MQYRTLDNGHTSFEVSALCLGTMYMGTRTDEETSFAILDRFVEAGGTFLDTANNYNAWVGGYGRDSEDVIGRWLAARGNRDELRIATKLGAAKKDPDLPLSTTPPTNYQGLAASTVDAEARESLRHLGTDHVDVLYGHVDDRETPLEETVGAFGKLVDEGLVGIPGISNVALWRLVEARETAARLGVAPYGAVQQCHSYVYPRPQPVRTSWATPELLDYAASTGTDGRPGLTVLAYSPLHQGVFVRDDKPFYDGADHAGSRARVAALRAVAAELGATPNQVALAWLLGGEHPVVPVFGASSVAQLDEALGALDLVLDDDVRARLDAV
ncbi:aldo/keto reductase [Promicromonospora thailandica]|uniref:Oxidoreductase n=1 Tax=Promicromonospora thailandica TaxID=765201 RepID=A0A9X2GC57_9MICO|nr:aldo/keto reductase [Promicromonospora thailandica]MCP2266441.1 putative oxidoreductase [Promicromonospora thailandica]